MKRSIWMVMVVAASMAVRAQSQAPPQTQTHAAPVVPVSAAVQKPTTQKKVELFTPLSKKLPRPNTDKVERVDGMSSQPWIRTIGPNPGWSAFPDPERRDVAFNVFWIGAPPTR